MSVRYFTVVDDASNWACPPRIATFVTIGKRYRVVGETATGVYFKGDDGSDCFVPDISPMIRFGDPVQKLDTVEHPSHYNQGGIECIDAIRASMSLEAFRGFCKGNQLKYLWRYESKGKPAEDLAKSNQYGQWLAETYSTPEAQ